MSDVSEQQLHAAFYEKLGAISSERSARLRARDYRPREHRVPFLPAMGAGATAVVAAVVAAVLLLSSGTPPAFAGWTPTPSALRAAGLAAARKTCGGVPAASVLATDARGPYSAIVYRHNGDPWQCVTEGRTVLLDETTQYPPSVVTVAPGQVTLPMISRAVRGAATAQLAALDRRSAALDSEMQRAQGAEPLYMKITGPQIPKVYVRQEDRLAQATFAVTTGPESLTAVSGWVGAGVNGVTFVLKDGTRVRATVGHGWYFAWWPGSSSRNAHEPASILVTTEAGTKRAPDSAKLLQSVDGPCLVLSSCRRAGAPPIRAGVAFGLKQEFALFRNAKPAPMRRVAPVTLQLIGVMSFFDLGLDESQMREVSFGDRGSILVVPGNEGVCIARTFRPAVDLGGGDGSGCAPLAVVLHAGFVNIVNGSTLVGLVPGGNTTVTVHFGSGRIVTVPVKDNTVLASFTAAPTYVSWRTVAGKPTRWPPR